jgi:methionyl-tRNA formyltransferase
MQKILFLGSRQLASNILSWLITKPDQVQIIGAVLPNFEGWWEDDLKKIVDQHDIVLFNTIEETTILEYDIILSINYWKLIPIEFLEKVNGRALNIHHSYKLKYRGRFSTSWAIMHARKDNEWIHGTTLHYIDESLDNGDILDSRPVKIEEDDTAESLFYKVEDLAFEMFKDNLNKILNDTISVIPPSEVFYYYDKDSNKEILLTEPLNKIDLYDYCRAWTFRNRPLPFIMIEGKKIELKLIEI